MKLNSRILLLFSVGLATITARAQITQFQHIIVIFQENRTPDNLFYTLYNNNTCSTHPDNTQYNIQTLNWLDASSPTGVTQPTGTTLDPGYDLNHSHRALDTKTQLSHGWLAQCDPVGSTTLCMPSVFPPTQCRMDGASCTSPNRGAFIFAENTVDTKHPLGILHPYLTLATSYGWANYMFQTNEGPSFPAYQYIFGGSSALSATDDANGIFVSENFAGGTGAVGCLAPDGESTQLAHPDSTETIYKIDHAAGQEVCIPLLAQGGRDTLADKLEAAGLGWKYYGAGAAGLWMAPNALKDICMPDPTFQTCQGQRWHDHVDLNLSQVLSDLGANKGTCNLSPVSWVTPTDINSDHPSKTGMDTNNGGPDWVASVVNALGQSPCTDTINGHAVSYWDDTAVVITWDDWGGFYDHQPPTFPEGGYQLGFRVPLIFVSAYAPVKYINNGGTILVPSLASSSTISPIRV